MFLWAIMGGGGFIIVLLLLTFNNMRHLCARIPKAFSIVRRARESLNNQFYAIIPILLACNCKFDVPLKHFLQKMASLNIPLMGMLNLRRKKNLSKHYSQAISPRAEYLPQGFQQIF